jgi:hypothetical protein
MTLLTLHSGAHECADHGESRVVRSGDQGYKYTTLIAQPKEARVILFPSNCLGYFLKNLPIFYQLKLAKQGKGKKYFFKQFLHFMS